MYCTDEVAKQGGLEGICGPAGGDSSQRMVTVNSISRGVVAAKDHSGRPEAA